MLKNVDFFLFLIPMYAAQLSWGFSNLLLRYLQAKSLSLLLPTFQFKDWDWWVRGWSCLPGSGGRSQLAQFCFSLLRKTSTQVQLLQESPPEAVDGGDLIASNAIALSIRNAIPSKRANPPPCLPSSSWCWLIWRRYRGCGRVKLASVPVSLPERMSSWASGGWEWASS